jgi:uncharacterized protein YjdB
MACKLPGYVGRDVLLEYGLACGDVNPIDPDFAWTPFASLRTKDFSLTWDTADASSDSSPNNLRENLATFQTLEISGDGVAKQATTIGEQSAFTILTKHVVRPGPAFSHQPVVWLRMTFPDLTFVSYMLITDLSRSATYDDVVTFSFTASAASSDFGLIVMDTPDPSAPAPTTVTVTPDVLPLADGATQQLAAVVAPSGASQNVSYESSAPLIASVSPTGLVTANSAGSAGSATITVTSTVDVSKSDTCAVTVT